MKLIRKFKDLNKNDFKLAGGKGASLGEMLNAGLPVPDGFVLLSKTFDNFLTKNNLNSEINAILKSVNINKTKTIEDASNKITSLIVNQELSKDVKDDILAYFKKLDSKFVAVRSSATAEDGAMDAWAGQLETYLNTTEKNLLEDIKKCWASLFTSRAIFYRFEKGLNKQKISVAVVVQKMIDSEISGIAFSVHPISQNHNNILIEAGYGLGEAIVSGQITPDSYVIQKNPLKILESNTNTQTRGIYKDKNGSNSWKEIPKSKRGEQKLSDAQILKLSKIILSIEKHYGFPCDIEWVLFENKFYIVQSRPITTLNSVFKIGDEEKWLERGAETDIHLFPVILHLKGIYLTKKLTGVPIGTFLMFSKKNTVQYLVKPGTLVKSGEKILKIIENDKNWVYKITDGLEKRLDGLLALSQAISRTNLSSKSDAQLLKIYMNYSKHVVEMMKYGSIAPIVEWEESLLSDRLNNILKDSITRQGLKESYLGEALSMLSAPLKRLWISKEQLSIYKILREIILNPATVKLILKNKTTFNALKSQNLPIAKMISVHQKKFHWVYYNYEGPEKREDYFMSIIREGLVDKKQINKRYNELLSYSPLLKKSQKEIIQKLKLSRDDFYWFKVAQEFSYQKGLRRDLSFKSYWQISRLLEEISLRLSLTMEQVRNITIEEMEKYLLERKINKKILIERINLCAILADRKQIQYLSGSGAEKLTKEVFVDLKINKSVKELLGNVAYPGKAIGHVKIIQRKEDVQKMRKGDILVSYATNPELVPAMKKAAAIVTDEGGITCHAAIVSREMKIPCVIGTKDASKIFKDGDLVEVDAERGYIKKLIMKGGTKNV
ncbi:TPA: hypothetical protein DIC62_01620 [Candidatus Nomurabacteria bacterium]|nr:hypothetical protein [Candidatus Nomurabacteria bacterium]